jgi:hypothetical protein
LLLPILIFEFSSNLHILKHLNFSSELNTVPHVKIKLGVNYNFIRGSRTLAVNQFKVIFSLDIWDWNICNHFIPSILSQRVYFDLLPFIGPQQRQWDNNQNKTEPCWYIWSILQCLESVSKTACKIESDRVIQNWNNEVAINILSNLWKLAFHSSH